MSVIRVLRHGIIQVLWLETDSVDVSETVEQTALQALAASMWLQLMPKQQNNMDVKTSGTSLPSSRCGQLV